MLLQVQGHWPPGCGVHTLTPLCLEPAGIRGVTRNNSWCRRSRRPGIPGDLRWPCRRWHLVLTEAMRITTHQPRDSLQSSGQKGTGPGGCLFSSLFSNRGCNLEKEMRTNCLRNSHTNTGSPFSLWKTQILQRGKSKQIRRVQTESRKGKYLVI